MSNERAETLRTLLDSYRARMAEGGHPKELPDRVLALVRDAPASGDAPAELRRLIAAAEHYWSLYADPASDNVEPDPLDLELVSDELIDALYDYYEA